jgi:hypothetical protein
MINCTYHDGFVYDNSSLELTKYISTDVSQIKNRDEFQLINYPQMKDDIERRKERFKFICYDTTVQLTQEATNGGCKKEKHGFGKLSKRNKILTKDHIDQWEQSCIDNDECCERWNRIFTNHSTDIFQ